MKMYSIKTMAFWFATAVLSNSALGFAHHSHHHHSHHQHSHCNHSHCHSHSHHCLRAEEFTEPAEAAFNTIVGDLNAIFVAESLVDVLPPAPGSQLAALIAAENGPGAGSIADAATAIRNLLLTLGVPQATADLINAQLSLFAQAAQAYSLTVATSAPQPIQQAALDNWKAQGALLAVELASLSPGLDLAFIQTLIANLINAESWAIQAYNLGFALAAPDAASQQAAAVAQTQQAHINVTELADYVFRQLVEHFNSDDCHRVL